jgi:hypothetical protein
MSMSFAPVISTNLRDARQDQIEKIFRAKKIHSPIDDVVQIIMSTRLVSVEIEGRIAAVFKVSSLM